MDSLLAPPRILHITGRSDHGGGPEHLNQILLSEANSTASFIACPTNGLYWDRYLKLVGAGQLCPIPHRRLSPIALLRLTRFVRRHDIGVIHSHGMSGGIYGRLVSHFCDLPCVHTFHGLPRTLTFKHGIYYQFERILSRLTHIGVAVSPSEARLINRRYPMYSNRLVTVENGIEYYDQVVNNRSARLASPVLQKRDIVSFTRMNAQKNPWLVLEIAIELRRLGKLSDLRFCLYGQDVDDQRFRQKIIAAGLSDHIHLFPPTDNPAQILARAFGYLSTSRWEGMPLSVLEAHREGTCVIASNVIGNRDLISNGRNGMLYREGDAAAAAKCIIAIQVDPDLRCSLRAEGASGCRQRHNRDLMVSRLQFLYRIAMDPKLRARLSTMHTPMHPAKNGDASSMLHPISRIPALPTIEQQLVVTEKPSISAGYDPSDLEVALN